MSKLIAQVSAVVRHDDDEGQGLAEYALILALIAIVAIVALLFLGNQVSDKLSVIGGTLESAAP
jgi:pilus assembly protein Flp/PilA